jgi:hypothetical protein
VLDQGALERRARGERVEIGFVRVGDEAEDVPVRLSALVAKLEARWKRTMFELTGRTSTSPGSRIHDVHWATRCPG